MCMKEGREVPKIRGLGVMCIWVYTLVCVWCVYTHASVCVHVYVCIEMCFGVYTRVHIYMCTRITNPIYVPRSYICM